MKCSRKKSFQVFCFPFIGLTFLVLPLLPPASNQPPPKQRSCDIQAPSQKVRNLTYISQDKF